MKISPKNVQTTKEYTKIEMPYLFSKISPNNQEYLKNKI